MSRHADGSWPLPADLSSLPELWHRAPRRWGHGLHSLCSYFAMFPPQLAHVFIEWLTQPGERVYDPFAGRGTVALEASLLGRTSFASDANPLAQVLAQSKTQIPSAASLAARLTTLQSKYRKSKVKVADQPAHIRMLYSSGTLKQLVYLRSELNTADPIDCFLVATILGMLHANHAKGGATRGFSVSMPNTFAMAPGYVARYIKEHQLVAPDVNVFEMLRARLAKLDLPMTQRNGGRSWLQDAAAAPPDWLQKDRVKLVFTSPPYLQVIKYGKYNWVRLWFLGCDWREVDEGLMASSSLSRYVDFMTVVCNQLAEVVTADGYVCLVIGDVRRPTAEDEGATINLADAVWERVAKPLGWQLHGIIADELPEGHKVSRIWKNNNGRATKIDRLLLMSPQPSALPPLVEPTWEKPSFAREGTAA